MAVFSYTQVDKIVGSLTNGKKIVQTTITITDTGTSLTTITVRPLIKIEEFAFFPKKPITTYTVTKPALLKNTISILPAASGNTGVLEFISVGV